MQFDLKVSIAEHTGQLTGTVFSQNSAGLGLAGMNLIDNAYVRNSTGDFAYLTSAKQVESYALLVMSICRHQPAAIHPMLPSVLVREP